MNKSYYMAITYFVVNKIYLRPVLKFLYNVFYPEDIFRKYP